MIYHRLFYGRTDTIRKSYNEKVSVTLVDTYKSIAGDIFTEMLSDITKHINIEGYDLSDAYEPEHTEEHELSKMVKVAKSSSRKRHKRASIAFNTICGTMFPIYSMMICPSKTIIFHTMCITDFIGSLHPLATESHYVNRTRVLA